MGPWGQWISGILGILSIVYCLYVSIIPTPVPRQHSPGTRGRAGWAGGSSLAWPRQTSQARTRTPPRGRGSGQVSDLTCPHTCPSTDLAVGVVPAHPRPQTRVQADPGAVQAASPVRALSVRAAVAGGGVAEADK